MKRKEKHVNRKEIKFSLLVDDIIPKNLPPQKKTKQRKTPPKTSKWFYQDCRIQGKHTKISCVPT